jgi:hypothetical protein
MPDVIKTRKSNLKIKKITNAINQKTSIQRKRNEINKQNAKNVDVIFGIDNGVTGTISAIIPYSDKNIKIFFDETFSNTVLDFTQEIKYFDRLDWKKTKDWFELVLNEAAKNYNKPIIKSIAVIERPMVNPMRFKPSLIAVRAFEALTIVLDMLKLNYIVIDSKKWQHYFFGKNTALLDLKKESMDHGLNIIDEYKFINSSNEIEEIRGIMKKHLDADAFLMAMYCLKQLR